MDSCNITLDVGFKTHPCNRYQGLNQDFYFIHRATKNTSNRNSNVASISDDSSKQQTSNNKQGGTLQTSPASASSSDRDFWIFGVLDGHYMLGEYASKIAAESFKKSFEQSVQSNQPLDDKVIESLFQKAHNDIINFYDKLPQQYEYPLAQKMTTWTLKTINEDLFYTSGKYERLVEFGTSCVTAILLPGYHEVIIANVGDCQACLISNTQEEPDVLKIGLLATIHNFENKDEVARITKNYNTKFTDDGYVCPNDPKYSSYQINMTRALGHKILSTFGVVPIPTISRFQLDSTLDQHLVLASDGLWDNLSEEEIVDIVAESATAQECADRLIDQVTGLMQYNDDIDNATMIVIHLRRKDSTS